MVASIHGDFIASSATRWHYAYVNLPQNDGRVSIYKTSLRIYMNGQLVAPRRGGRLGSLIQLFGGVLGCKATTGLERAPTTPYICLIH